MWSYAIYILQFVPNKHYQNWPVRECSPIRYKVDRVTKFWSTPLDFIFLTPYWWTLPKVERNLVDERICIKQITQHQCINAVDNIWTFFLGIKVGMNPKNNCLFSHLFDLRYRYFESFPANTADHCRKIFILIKRSWK